MTTGDQPVRLGAAADAFRLPTLGLDAVAARLALALARGRPAHAYLLAGPNLAGKRRLARWLAQALLCLEPRSGQPCGECRSCRLVVAGQHPDMLLAESPLKVDATRQLLADLALMPLSSPRRVALLADIDQATTGAANSLLKTLEEPPSRAVLILTAGQPDRVLSTIRSRCRVVSVRPAGPVAVAELLTRLHGLPPEAAMALGRRSGGRLDWALQELGDHDREQERLDGLLLLERLLAAPRSERLRHAAEMARRTGTMDDLLEGWIGWWRDLLLWRNGLFDSIVNHDRSAALAGFSGRMSQDGILAMISSTEDALRRLRANGAAQLILETLLLEMPT
jgi:DNA polymerase-3 subunit delta'